MTRFMIVVATLAMAGCGGETPPPSPPPEQGAADPAGPTWVVSPLGVGSVQIGWTVAELNQHLGESLRPTYQISDECDQLRPAAFPRGLSLMVILDTVMRVDVDTTGIVTAEGAGVGDSEDRVLSLYAGRVEVQPHKYTGPAGHYLIVSVPGDTLSRIIFETDGRSVLNYRAGRRPAVELIEGCA